MEHDYKKFSMYEYGKAYKKLGMAMMSDKTTITKLSDLAFEAGLQLQFQIVQQEKPKP